MLAWLLLLFLQVPANSIEIIIELPGILVASFPDFFNDWILNHLSVPL